MPTGLLLSDDLMFSSRIAATARATGVAVKTVRGADQLLALVEKDNPSCVIVDLANPTLRIAEFIRRLHESCTPRPQVVAYGPCGCSHAAGRPRGRLRPGLAAEQVCRGSSPGPAKVDESLRQRPRCRRTP